MYFITVAAVGEEKASRGGVVLDLEEGPERSLGDQRGGGTWRGEADCEDGVEGGPQELRGKEAEMIP